MQIYEAVLADLQGSTTHRLLHAVSFSKDNRLLPRGWSPEHPDAPRTAPVGTVGDADFTAGGDTGTLHLRRVRVPRTVPGRGALLYQTLGPRHASELFRFRTAEVIAFRRYYERSDPRPEVLCESRATVDA